jgi:single-stranded DNA-binding protein
MNSCILMAEIVQEPQLRYTPDNTALAEMLVQFPGIRAEDPPATLKVIGWGNLAQEIQQQYHQGDRVIIEGRLSMNTVDRPEGFKEKRAELTVQRIHSLGDGTSIGSSATVSAATTGNPTSSDPSVVSRTSEKVASRNAGVSSSPRTLEKVATASTADVVTDFDAAEPVPQSAKPKSPTTPLVPSEAQDIDDIPFVRAVDSKTVALGLLDFYEINSQCPQIGISHSFKFI